VPGTAACAALAEKSNAILSAGIASILKGAGLGLVKGITSSVSLSRFSSLPIWITSGLAALPRRSGRRPVRCGPCQPPLTVTVFVSFGSPCGRLYAVER
jgi:hypothetical protein